MRKIKKHVSVLIIFIFMLNIVLPGMVWANSTSTTGIIKGNITKGYDVAEYVSNKKKAKELQSKIGNKLQNKLQSMDADKELIPVIIQLKDKPDFTKLNSKITKSNYTPAAVESHKNSVMNLLETHTQQKHAKILNMLKERETAGKANQINDYWLFNGLTAKVDRETLLSLASDPDVERIVLNDLKFTKNQATNIQEQSVLSTVYGNQQNTETVSNNVYNNSIAANSEWNINKIGANQVWSKYTGKNIIIGQLDTGIDPTHKDLLINQAGSASDTTNWKVAKWASFDSNGALVTTNLTSAYDCSPDGHGTHVAGIMVGGSASGTNIGVAPDAKLYEVQVMSYYSSTGEVYGTFEQCLAGMQYIVTLPGVQVVNMSWGAQDTDYFDLDATENMERMLVFPSASIGNSGQPNAQYSDTTGSPGNTPYAFGVGSVDSNDEPGKVQISGQNVIYTSGGIVPWYLNEYSPQYYVKPDISAPGDYVKSSIPGNKYAVYQGTSMAAPHVAGSVALILQANPWLSVEEVKSLLKITSTDLGAAGTDVTFGAGRLNINDAIGQLTTGGFVTGCVTGPDGEPVIADIIVDGKLLAKSDPKYGSYDLMLPAGSHEIIAKDIYYREAKSNVSVTAGDYVDNNFNLEKKVLGSVGGLVKDELGHPMPWTWVKLEAKNESYGGNLFTSYGERYAYTDDQGRYRIDNVLEGDYVLRVTPDLPYAVQRVNINMPESSQMIMNNITVKACNMLVVGPEDGTETSLMQSLQDNNYNYAFWDTSYLNYFNGSYGYSFMPDIGFLKQNFSKMLLLDQKGNAINTSENYYSYSQHTFSQFLDSGRKLFVSGRDIGYYTQFRNTYYSDFYKNYLHAKYNPGDGGTWQLRGDVVGAWPKGICNGMDFNISPTYDTNSNTMAWPDVVSPADNQANSVIYPVESAVAGSSALAIDGPLHRLMYFSFDFNDIGDASIKTQLGKTIVTYLDAPTDDTSKNILYSQSWNSVTNAQATAGHFYTSNGLTNSYCSYLFSGDNITWVTAKGPNYGIAKVYIDGVLKQTVDLYNATPLWNQCITIKGLTVSTHTIKVIMTNTKNASSKATDITLDAYKVTENENKSSVKYSSGWTSAANTSSYAGSYKYSKTKGTYATYSFNGNGVTLIANTSPTYGIAAIYLDGSYKGMVDLYSLAPAYNKPVKTFYGLSNGDHQLKIVVTGTKNAASTDYTVALDAFDEITEDNNPVINFSSGWTTTAAPSAYNGSFFATTQTNATAQYSFVGTSGSFYVKLQPNAGIAKVYIDGIEKSTIDLYSATNKYNVRYDYAGLLNGKHTMVIVNTGTKNSNSTGTVLGVDAFEKGLND